MTTKKVLLARHPELFIESFFEREEREDSCFLLIECVIAMLVGQRDMIKVHYEAQQTQ